MSALTFAQQHGGKTLQVPRSALVLQVDAFDTEQAAAEDDGTRPFRGKANSGEIIQNHWFWGNFAVDMDGLRVTRQDVPVMLDHDDLLGFTTKIEKSNKGIDVEGRLIDASDRSAEVLRFMAKGMPFQMSVYVPPDRGGIERVEDGQTVEVNGRKLKGPGAVFRKSTLREVTITALGADEKTSAALLSHGDGAVEYDNPQPEERARSMKPNEITVALLKEQNPQVHAEIADAARSEGVAAERERIAFINSKSKGVKPELVQQAITEGWDKETTLTKFFDYVSEHKEARITQLREQHGESSANGVDDPEAIADDDATFQEGVDGKGKGKSDDDTPDGPDKWREEFKRSEQLQEEFAGDADAYVAYRQHPESRRERRNKAVAS